MTSTGAPISPTTPGGLPYFIERMRHDWNAHPSIPPTIDPTPDINLLLDKLDHMRQLVQNLLDSGSPLVYKPSDDHPGERTGYIVSPELYELLQRVVA